MKAAQIVKLCHSWDHPIDGELIPSAGGFRYRSSGGDYAFDAKAYLSQLQREFPRGHGVRQDLLMRAICPKGRSSEGLKVADMSFGTGKDALKIFHFGCQVWATERHPLVYALGKAALEAAEIDIELRFWSTPLDFDVVYFDPMYGSSKKSKSKLRMELFKSLVGEDSDQQEIAQALRGRLRIDQRLVIKRAEKGPLLLEGPTFQIQGKAVRYDVYQGRP